MSQAVAERLMVVGACLLTALLLGLRLSPDSSLRGWDDQATDLALSTMDAPEVDPAVTVVLVDDESLKRLGQRWPLDRGVWAAFLERLTPLKPAVVALDVYFESPAPKPQVELALDLADALRDGPLGDLEEGEALANALDKKAAKLDSDRRLSKAIAKLGKVVLGVNCAQRATDASKARDPVGLRAVKVKPEAPLRCGEVSGSFSRLASAARAEAGLAVPIDADGYVRHYAYFGATGKKIYASLALAAATVAEDESPASLAASIDGGRPQLDFPLGKGFRVVRFSDVLEAEAGPALKKAFEGRRVLVGVSAGGTTDFMRVARAQALPGIFIHAAALSSLSTGAWLRSDTEVGKFGGALGLVFLLVLALVAGRIERATVVLVLGAVAAALWTLCWARALQSGHLPALMPGLIGLLVWTLVRLGFIYARASDARKQARTIRRAFQHYLAPEVVEALVADPDKLRLGGERREITAFFSDIKGFTTLSEQLEPSELVGVLNEVLGRMSDIIVSEGGIIDKYIGDAVVAMFGAPMEQPDHALRACRAALRCQVMLKELRTEWADRDLPPISMRIGLNTGQALVGNMGSANRYDYTMLGDTVNLAARLEALNGAYSTAVMCGEGTALQLPEADSPPTRELDLVRPKGKKIGVRIFEVVDDGVTFDVRYVAALQAYRDQRWDEAEALFTALKEAGEPPAETFLDRIARYRLAPPGPDWDGIYTMTTK